MNGRFTISITLFFALGLGAATVQGQVQSYPNAGYYQTFYDYYDADYRNALKNFNRGFNTAYRVGTDRFMDSICYWVMMGECHYHVGNYAQAIELYEQALKLYLRFQSANWQSLINYPDIINADLNAANKVQVNWGISQRGAGKARVPSTMGVTLGAGLNTALFNKGLLQQQAEVKSFNVAEIMRCTALALHRRRVIKGVTCSFDPFSSQLVTELSKFQNAPAGSLAGAWNRVLLGLAQASNNDWKSAASTLGASLQITGGMDHGLTSIALLELAYAALAAGQSDQAAQLALEASYSAAMFFNYDMVEEALGLGNTIHLMNNRTPYPPLENAIGWANRNKARMMQASLIVKLAECHAEGGNGIAAKNILANSTRVLSRNSLKTSVVNSRLRYVNAVIGYLGGESEGGRAELQAALQQFTNGSRWLYQLSLADNLVVAGNISQRQGDAMYRLLLGDPAALQWKLDPLEAMSFLTSNHVPAMERWFTIKINLKAYDEALEVGELIRRHRYFSQMPMGGRLMAFRWILHAPIEALSKDAIDQRIDFLNRFPDYKTLSDKGTAIRNELMKLPLKPADDSDEQKRQTELFVEMLNISDVQEAMLSSFALRRQPAEMSFPPFSELSVFRKKMNEDQLAFVSLATADGYHLFLLTAENTKYLGMPRTRDVKNGIGKILKGIGLQDPSGGVDLADLADEEWKERSHELYKWMFGEITDEGWAQFSELVVVPDGLMWYLPFELLHTGPDATNLTPLEDRIRIRYSPTLFLAYGIQRPQRTVSRQAVVEARMHPKGELEHTQAVVTQLENEIPTIVKFSERLRIPSNYLGSILDALIVMSDLKVAGRVNPFALVPAQLDQGKKGSNLAAWLSLPWNGPEHLALPGYSSGGAAGVRSKGDGSDLFLTSVSLIAAGSRSIMLSRWRVGGKNSMEFTREYARNLASQGPMSSFLAARKFARDLDLDVDFEPRIKTKKLDNPTKADHPFFWSSYLLIEVPDRAPVAKDAGDKLPDNIAPKIPPADPGQQDDDPGKPGGGDANQKMQGDDEPKKQGGGDQQQGDQQQADKQQADKQQADKQQGDKQQGDKQQGDQQQGDQQQGQQDKKGGQGNPGF